MSLRKCYWRGDSADITTKAASRGCEVLYTGTRSSTHTRKSHTIALSPGNLLPEVLCMCVLLVFLKSSKDVLAFSIPVSKVISGPRRTCSGGTLPISVCAVLPNVSSGDTVQDSVRSPNARLQRVVWVGLVAYKAVLPARSRCMPSLQAEPRST